MISASGAQLPLRGEDGDWRLFKALAGAFGEPRIIVKLKNSLHSPEDKNKAFILDDCRTADPYN